MSSDSQLRADQVQEGNLIIVEQRLYTVDSDAKSCECKRRPGGKVCFTVKGGARFHFAPDDGVRIP